jgi:hypothetical protein
LPLHFKGSRLRIQIKKGDDRWDHRLSRGEGGWDGGVFSFFKSTDQWETLLHQSKQSRKEIRDKECVGKDQGPSGHPLKTDLDSSYTVYLTDTEELIAAHLFFRQLLINESSI